MSLTVRDVFKFGKYNGQTIGTIIGKDPKYVEWAQTKLDSFTLDETAGRLLAIKLSMRRSPRPVGVSRRDLLLT